MDILIGSKYEKEFTSIFRLVDECPAFSSESLSVIDSAYERVIVDGKDRYTYNSIIPNAQFRDDDDDDTDDELGFNINGASWFRGLRGEKSAESADSRWMRFIEKIARLYHKKYSIIEYKQQKEDQIKLDDAYAIAHRIVRFLYPSIDLLRRDFIKVTEADIVAGEALDIYGLSLLLALSGGTGESKRILGKVYFSGKPDKKSNRVTLAPMLKGDAEKIDNTFSSFTGDDDDGEWDATNEDENAKTLRIEGLRENALGALETLINDESMNFVDYLFSDEGDQRIISDMLELTAHTTSDLQCNELKVLGISHIQWRTTVYDCIINGSRRLRIVFGLNNSVSIKCLGCDDDAMLVKDNMLYLKKPMPNSRSFVYLSDTNNELTMGLSDEEMALVQELGVHNDHLRTISCKGVGLGETCSCVRCNSQILFPEDPDSTNTDNMLKGARREYCRDCHRPEVICFDTTTQLPLLTSNARFAIDKRGMISKADAVECELCGRHYQKGTKTENCPICGMALAVAEGAEFPEDVLADASALYGRYAQTVPITARLSFSKKYAFEDEGMVLLVIGKNIYRFDKLDAKEQGQMLSARKLIH